MPTMTQRGDNKAFQSWLCESVLALCRGGLSYSEDFSIEGVLGITIDHSEVILVRIHDEDTMRAARSEKAVQVCLEDHTSTPFSDTASVEENDVSALHSDPPSPDSDPPPSGSDPLGVEQTTVITLPLVRTLHNKHRSDPVSIQTNHGQLPPDSGDFQWHMSEPLVLGSQNVNCETKAEARAQIESDLDSSMPGRNLGAANLIPSAEVSDITSDEQSSQPVFDTVDVYMNSGENTLTKIKQELNVECWNEQSRCDSYEPGGTFGNYPTQQRGASDLGSSHNLLRVVDSSQQAQNHFVKIAPRSMNAVGDMVSVSLGTAMSTPIQNWTWCRLCKQGTRNLKKHMNVCPMSPAILGEAKFSCTKCNRLFKTRSYLVDHERSFHSNVPSYECNNCRRLFKYRMQLKRHKVNCSGAVANGTLPAPYTQQAVT